MLNAPPNIVHFVCGSYHSLFLDLEGNVFYVGDNEFGQRNKRNRSVLNKITNVPPIKIISCARSSCYLIDFEGNLWNYGKNDEGQQEDIPEIIDTLKDIQQISYGCCGSHFFAKNTQNQIFVTGYNYYGQLGTGDIQLVSTPKEMDSQYSIIWKDEFYIRAKSARK